MHKDSSSISGTFRSIGLKKNANRIVAYIAEKFNPSSKYDETYLKNEFANVNY